MESSGGHPTREELFGQLKCCLDLYAKHHDLFIKTIALSFGVLGAIAGFMYSNHVSIESRRALSAVIAFFPLITAFGSGIYRLWVREMEQLAGSLTTALGLQPFSFSATLKATVLFIAMSALLALVALLNAFRRFL